MMLSIGKLRCPVRWLGRACVVASLLFTGVASATDYPCVNERQYEARFSRWFVKEAYAIPIGPGMEGEIERLREKATTPHERTIVDLLLGLVLLTEKRAEESKAVLEPLLADPYLPRAQLDYIRSSLALMESTRGQHDAVISLLEPVFKARCAPMPGDGSLALAKAFVSRGRDAEALEVLDEGRGAELPKGDDWPRLHAELRCKLENSSACVRQISRSAAAGISDELRADLDGLLQAVVTAPDASDEVAKAQAIGLIDGTGKLIASNTGAGSLQPIFRYAPQFPRNALRKGLTGFVHMALTVGADGKVTDAKVLDSEPPGVFEEAALDSARRSTFKPGEVDGKPVVSHGSYVVKFSLGRWD